MASRLKMKMILIVFMLLSLSSCAVTQTYWDLRVSSLCHKDGGIIIFEHVQLTQEEYIKNYGLNGYIRISPESTTNSNQDFYTKSINTVLRNSESFAGTYVEKSVTTTYRKSDNKPMEQHTYYFRRGGDNFFLQALGSHPSAYGCSQIPEVKERYKERFYTIENLTSSSKSPASQAGTPPSGGAP